MPPSPTTATDANEGEEPDWRRRHRANVSERRARLDDASRARADRLAGECRARLLEAVDRIASDAAGRDARLGILLSGGVDSCAVLEACRVSNAPLEAAVTVSIADDDGAVPEDERYARAAVGAYNAARRRGETELAHRVVRLSPARLVAEYSRPVARRLAVWGCMETRNSLIMSAGFDRCADLGLTDVLTGDNADELLGGSYDWYFRDKYASRPGEWIAKRNGTADLPFATSSVAGNYDPVLHQPFRNRQLLVEWATGSTGRADCIDVHGSCSLQEKWGGPYTTRHNCGKLPLREAFCTVASWRTMDWIFRGSGAGDGGLVEYYETLYSNEDFEREQARYLQEEGVRLLSKEHLHNIRVYEGVFGGLRHPTKPRYGEGDPRGCVDCRFDHGDEDFCHLCDAYPARPREAVAVAEGGGGAGTGAVLQPPEARAEPATA